MAMPLLGQYADDYSRQAVNGALVSSRFSMAKAPFGKSQVAVLPIRNDLGNYVFERVKNIITECGFDCVEGKNEPMWDEILREIAWDTRKNDILDPKTLVTFGKLKAPQILVYGSISQLSKTQERIYAEIVLHATDLRTKQHIWGGTFAYRFYPAENVKGIIDLDSNLRNLLTKNFETAAQDLAQKVPLMKNVKSVTVIPLAGDIDHYMTNLAITALTRSGLAPRNPRIPTLSMVENIMRDKLLDSDAILYGAVRDLSIAIADVKFDYAARTKKISYVYHTDIQLILEDARTRNILWSSSINLPESPETGEIPLTQEELDSYQKDVIRQQEREKELDERARQLHKVQAIWELEKKLIETKNEAELKRLHKQIEQMFNEQGIRDVIKITEISTEKANADREYTETQTKLRISTNELIAAQEEAKNVQATAFNRLVETQEKLKVIKSQTDIPVTQIQLELAKIVDQIEDVKRQETVRTAEAQLKIQKLQNQMQTGLINLEKQKIELNAMSEKIQQGLQADKARLETEIAGLRLDLQERQTNIDLTRTKNDFWWVTLPRTIGFIALGVITIVIVLAIIRGILSTWAIR